MFNKYISYLIYSLITLVALYSPFFLNKFALAPQYFGGQFFLNQITNLFSQNIISYIKVIIPIFLIIFLSIKYFNKEIIVQKFFILIKSINEINQQSIIINIILLFIFSMFFKLYMLDFNLNFGSLSNEIENINNNQFNVYKLHIFIATFFYDITNSYNIYLNFLNIIYGSLAIVIFYKILTLINNSNLVNLFVSILCLLYLPLTAADTIITKIDSLYFLLFILSIYFVIQLTHKNNTKYILLLTITLFISCFAREQTLYILPLLIFYILISSSQAKFFLISLISLVVLSTSLFISNYNFNKYGITSLFRDRILIINAMQYGYFNPITTTTYYDKLSANAKDLHGEINNAYKNNILPSKRESFYAKYGFMSHIRPDYLNVNRKNLPGSHILSKSNVKKNLDKISEYIKINKNKNNITFNKENFSRDIHAIKNQSDIVSDKRILDDIQWVIEKDFFGDGSLSYLRNDDKECKQNSYNCLFKLVKDDEDIYSRLLNYYDNYFYTHAAISSAPKFNFNDKIYTQSKNIDYAKEIVLAKPFLYISQSLLQLFGMTGYVPVPTAMTEKITETYESGVSHYFLYNFQELYYPIINFWYIYCFLSFVFVLFWLKEHPFKSEHIFIALIPIYYGLFLSFANYAEFARLILPVVPFILFNYIKTYQRAPIPMTLLFFFGLWFV